MSLIKDPYLKQVIQNTLGPDVPLTQSTLQTISVLDASHQQIQSLDGIEHCRHLQKLYLDSNLITNLSPLKQLVTDHLTELQLNDNQISDLSPLAKLTFPRLTDLGLGYNKIENLSPLKQAHLQNLKTIYLNNNKITDLSPLQHIPLPNLASIFLEYNHITDCSPLLKNNSLNSLSLILIGNPIQKLDHLPKNAEQLSELYLDNTGIKDLSPLSHITLKNLTILSLNYNDISDVTPINPKTVPNLVCLNLEENSVTDLQPLLPLSLHHESLENQRVTLPKLTFQGPTLTIMNPITNKNGEKIPPRIHPNYTYDPQTNTITWQNISNLEGFVSFEWEEGSFDGEAIQPYKKEVID